MWIIHAPEATRPHFPVIFLAAISFSRPKRKLEFIIKILIAPLTPRTDTLFESHSHLTHPIWRGKRAAKKKKVEMEASIVKEGEKRKA